MPREQFHRGLQDLQDGILELGSMVDRQIDRSMRCLLDRDLGLANTVIRDDEEVNRTRFHLDNVCVSLLAQQAPLASDLRFIVAALAMLSELERMGDHASGIASIVVTMQDEPLVKPLVDIPAMAPNETAMSLKGGGAVKEFVVLEKKEQPLALVDIQDGSVVALGTRRGVVKRVTLDIPKSDVFDVIKLDDNDEVVGAVIACGASGCCGRSRRATVLTP